MQLSFRSVSKPNALPPKPAVSPALLLWMQQNNSSFDSSISNQPIVGAEGWKLAAIVTTLFACTATFTGTLHILNELADFEKIDNVRRQIIQEAKSDSSTEVTDPRAITIPANVRRSADRERRQIAGGIGSGLRPSVDESSSAVMIEKPHESFDHARRQIAQGMLPDLKIIVSELEAVEGSLDLGGSFDRARRQITGILDLLSTASDFHAAAKVAGTHQSVDAERRQIKQGLHEFPTSLSELGPVAKVEGTDEPHDRARRQITPWLLLELKASDGNPVPKSEGNFAAQGKTIRDFGDARLPAADQPAPAPPRHNPELSVQKDRQSFTRYASREGPTTVSETESEVNSSGAASAPKPTRKPKRSISTKKISFTKAKGRCWNRIWRC